jgi:hypothetical protein
MRISGLVPCTSPASHRLQSKPKKALPKAVGLLLVVLFGSIAMSFGQVFPTQQGGSAAATNTISPVPNFGTLVIDYDFLTIPDTMDVYYNGTNIFSSGLINGAGQFTIPYGPGPSSSLMIVMDQDGGADISTLWTYQPTVVPEPGYLALFGLGLPVLAFCRRGRLLKG